MAFSDALSMATPNENNSLEPNFLKIDEVKDKWYQKMFRLIREKHIYKHVKPDNLELKDPLDQWKLVVPKEKRLEILQSCHYDPKPGHLGIYKNIFELLGYIIGRV